jgi:3-deoxy-D-arabino-heptulosonate 7-phosphate (DAHP) synthase
MLLRSCAFALFSLTLPAMAYTASMPEQEDNSPTLTAIFQMAKREMPLPVLKVVTWLTSEGKRQIAIEMSTAGFAWAKKPVMNVMFQAKDKSLDDVEQKLHDASVAAREFIEAVKSDHATKPSHGIH